ncbi:MAG TPA: hydrogenase maturation protease [Pseudomonadota bacterium]|nr:hydrogenase maturation protease [Pseudomonadota bacterium]
MNGRTAPSHLHVAARARAARAPRVLVLGYGNPGRQDDGLGPAAAAEIEKLDWPGLTAYDNYQLVIEDAVEIAEHDVVWFVDAARKGSEPYEVLRLSPALDLAFTSHLVRPEVLLAIADQYYGKSPGAYLVGIRGYEFEFLEGLTDRASGNLEQAVAFIRHRIGRILEMPQ